MKVNEWTKLGQVAAVATILTVAIGTARAQTSTEIQPFSKTTGSVHGCPGAYTGLVKMTNNPGGGILVTPPANTTSGTFTDASSFGSNYVSDVYVMRNSDYMSWCGTNNVTFPVSSGDQFYLTIYVKNNPPPPTNGQQIVAQINWKQ